MKKKTCAEGPRAVAGGIEQGRSRAAVLWRRPALCVQHSGTDPPALTRVRTSVRDTQSSTGSARASCSASLHVTARASATGNACAGCSRERERERDAFAAYGSIHRVSARSSQLRAHAKSALARVFSCITAQMLRTFSYLTGARARSVGTRSHLTSHAIVCVRVSLRRVYSQTQH